MVLSSPPRPDSATYSRESGPNFRPRGNRKSVANTVALATPECTPFIALPERCGNFWALEKEQMLNKRLTAITVLSFLYGVIIGLLDCVAKIGSQPMKGQITRFYRGNAWAGRDLGATLSSSSTPQIAVLHSLEPLLGCLRQRPFRKFCSSGSSNLTLSGRSCVNRDSGSSYKSSHSKSCSCC